MSALEILHAWYLNAVASREQSYMDAIDDDADDEYIDACWRWLSAAERLLARFEHLYGRPTEGAHHFHCLEVCHANDLAFTVSN